MASVRASGATEAAVDDAAPAAYLARVVASLDLPDEGAHLDVGCGAGALAIAPDGGLYGRGNAPPCWSIPSSTRHAIIISTSSAFARVSGFPPQYASMEGSVSAGVWSG